MKIVQCVPNFSEGRDRAVIEAVVAPLKDKEGFKLVGYEPDASYNRTVVTLLGNPEEMIGPLLSFVGKAAELIDLNRHKGEHPRMGAVDVIPFVPIKNIKMAECAAFARELGEKIASGFQIPVFLYEEAAADPSRQNLADIRRGEFEGMREKIKKPEWRPDFGPAEIHPTAGAVAVGARAPLIAYNINLSTADIGIAKAIAKAVRHSGGGFRYVKAGAAKIEGRDIVQVTMNLTDYRKTAVYRVFEAVKTEAKRYGVAVLGSEIVGMLPLEAALDSLAYYLGLESLPAGKILETHLLEK
ncbi:MAG: glutamate formimidoyltransferase [Bacilli bacterium]|nr:glutamate formimidoyltransferase [Acholeplasmataceae bacterium]